MMLQGRARAEAIRSIFARNTAHDVAMSEVRAQGLAEGSERVRKLLAQWGLGSPSSNLGTARQNVVAPVKSEGVLSPDRLFVDRESERARSEKEPTVEQVTLILPDAHIPYHDQGANELAMLVAEEVKPTRIVILGDWIDCAPLSKHERTAKIQSIAAEVEGGRYWLSALESLSSVREKIFCEGNHEFRMTRYMQNTAQGLDGLAGLSIPEALKLSENGWRFVPYNEHVSVGGVTYTHEVGYCGALSARQSGLSVSTPIVIGHNHVVTGFEMNSIDREARQSWSFGWTGRHEDVKYKHRARALREWAHCIGVGYGDDRSTWLQPCVMRNGATYVNGKRVKV